MVGTLAREGSQTRRFTAAGLVVVLLFELCAAVAMDWAAPRRAMADPFTAVTLMQTMDSAIAAQGGTAAAGSYWQAHQPSQRAAAGLTTILAKAGVNVQQETAAGRMPALLAVSMMGMQARNTWNAFTAGCESAYAYGGYLWAKFSGLGIWDMFAVQQVAVEGTGVSYTNVNSTLATNYTTFSESRRNTLATYGALFYTPSSYQTKTPYTTNITADMLQCLQWCYAVLVGRDAHGAPFNVTFSSPYIKLNGTSIASIDGNNYFQTSGLTASAATALVTAAASVAHTGGLGGTAAATYYPDVTAPGYTTNPDVLPIPVEADVPAIVNPTTDDVQAIDFPTTGDVVPWVPPIWMPKTSALDLSGAADAIGQILEGLANALGETWAGLLAPFTGILGALQALLNWLDALIAWVEALVANIFSPSWEAVQTEFGPRWNDFKNRLSNMWPFAVGPLATLVVGSLAGGNLSGGRHLSTSWHIVLIKIGNYEVSFDMDLGNLTEPVEGYRGWLVAMVWITLVGAVVWRLTPYVVT